MTPLTRQQVENFLAQFKGRRGHDIPETTYDQIYPVANGITRQIWGTPPMPQQVQYLYDNGITEPDKIHAAFGSLPHPHSPSVTVGEYQKYSQAKQLYDQHQTSGRK